MDVAISPFRPEHLASVMKFSEEYWKRPRTASYYRWRYLDSESLIPTYLALSGEECLGMVCGFRKRYIIAGVPTDCLEVFDWHCLPRLRGSGLGIRLMRAMMRRSERVVSIGGTDDVRSALPAMGWQRIGTARVFELPTSGVFLADGLQRRTGLPASVTRVFLDVLAHTWYRPRGRFSFRHGRVTPVSLPGEEILSLYRGDTGYQFVQEPQPSALRWITSGYPGVGTFCFLHFAVDGGSRGWSLSRVYPTSRGLEAALLDVFAPRPTVPLYSWMVGEAARALSGFGPEMIRARATCPNLQEALRVNRFRETERDVPVHTWPGGYPESDSPLHVTLNHADEPLRPYGTLAVAPERETSEPEEHY